MKRLFFLILSFSHFLIFSAFAQEISISTVEGLKAIATNVNEGIDNYSGKTIRLTADLDLSAEVWSPIGIFTHPFAGTFDGGGHTISNLFVNTEHEFAGLFGNISSGATVKDVHLRRSGDASITSKANVTRYVGSIAGRNAGTIVGCSNSELVSSGSSTVDYVGGIVGENASGGVVQNCFNLGTVYKEASTYIGGIVGNNAGTVQNCFNKCSVVVVGEYVKSYPVCGNNSGSVIGCFYSGGAAGDATGVVSLANASSNDGTLYDNNGLVKNLLLNDRTLSTSGNWVPLCLPFSIAKGSVDGYSPIAGATVVALNSSSYNSSTDNLSLRFAEVDAIEAGKPYLVKWNTDVSGISNPVFMNVTVSNTINNAVTDYANFVGCFSPVLLTANDQTVRYIGSNSTLYYPTVNVNININSFRGYFQFHNLPTSVKSFSLDFDNETGITEITEKTEATEACYDMSGRRILKPTKGLYIKNGRKVLY